MKKIKFAVRKVKDKWRTVDEDDEHNFTIKAKKGDEITWRALGSDISFQFPDSTLFKEGIYFLRVEDGKKVTLTVASTARENKYTYAVFIHKDFEFARGESPPKIIIWKE